MSLTEALVVEGEAGSDSGRIGAELNPKVVVNTDDIVGKVRPCQHLKLGIKYFYLSINDFRFKEIY